MCRDISLSLLSVYKHAETDQRQRLPATGLVYIGVVAAGPHHPLISRPRPLTPLSPPFVSAVLMCSGVGLPTAWTAAREDHPPPPPSLPYNKLHGPVARWRVDWPLHKRVDHEQRSHRAPAVVRGGTTVVTMQALLLR